MCVLQTFLYYFHKKTSKRYSIRCTLSIQAQNGGTNLQQPHLFIKGLILVRGEQNSVTKFNLSGVSYGVLFIRPSPLVYIFEKLATRVTERVQCARLAKYETEIEVYVGPSSISKLEDRIEAKYVVLSAIVDVYGKSER